MAGRRTNRYKMKVAENLQTIEENILQACEKVKSKSRMKLKLIAVTKYVSIERAKKR